jgi:hypothetical protein
MTDTLLTTVESIVKSTPGLTAGQIHERIGDSTTYKRVAVALNNLLRMRRAHSESINLRSQGYYPGPRPATTRATPPTRDVLHTTWAPPRWTNEIARPGGEAHKQFGSLQADGTVRPYHAPVHGCTGTLKSNVNQGRD